MLRVGLPSLGYRAQDDERGDFGGSGGKTKGIEQKKERLNNKTGGRETACQFL